MATGTPQSGNNANAETNLLNMEWRFHEWIMGMGGLNPDNVLDYFALSPFWDPECNNAVLKMQTKFNNLGEMKQRLSEMTGVEFALVHERYPTLFVIQKQRRTNPQQVKPLAIYYVLQGSIYQCPDLQTLLSNRILGSLFHVESAFNEARTMKEFHPSTGYHWKSSASAIEGSSTNSTTTATITPAPTSIPTTTTSTTTATAGSSSSSAFKAESQEFRFAVDRAIKNVEQRAQMQHFMLHSGAPRSTITTPGTLTDAKFKQEGTSPATSTTASKATPKTATKRRKKSEEASAAAASMGINTNVPGISQTGGSGRPPSAGGANTPSSGGPTTPGATPTKRRKKTKNLDPK